jgi:hypothetical protein
MTDGYYLMQLTETQKSIPVEVYTIFLNHGEAHQYVRGLDVACTLRRAIETGHSFERLYTAGESLIAGTVGNMENFLEDSSLDDLDAPA